MHNKKIIGILALALCVVIGFSGCGLLPIPKTQKDLPVYTPSPAKRGNIALSDMEYKRPVIEDLEALTQTFIDEFAKAKTAQEQIDLFLKVNADMSKEFEMITLAHVRYQLAVTPENQEERDYVTEYGTGATDCNIRIYEAFLKSPFRAEMESYFGADMLEDMQIAVDEYDPEIEKLDEQVTKLSGEYDRVHLELSSLPVVVDGVEYTSSEVVGMMVNSTDADELAVLDAALLAYYEEINIACDDLYSQMLTLRNQQAELAGYESYPAYALAYSGYDLDTIKTYVKDIKEIFVPIMEAIWAQGEEAIGRPITVGTYALAIYPMVYGIYEEYYDPEATDEENDLAEYKAATEVLRKMMPETKELINYMEKYELIDVMPSEQKSAGAATMFFYNSQEPIFFADSVNATTIIHESGHALNFYMLPQIDLSERFSVGTEIAEIHSMGLEMLAHPYYEMMYGDTADYAIAYALFDGLEAILTQTMFYEFEMSLYENPDLTRTERNDLYAKLRSEYAGDIPGISIYSESGLSWVDVLHFFSSPLYTIDYTLAQSVAFELWEIQLDDPDAAQKKYMDFLLDNQTLDLLPRLENAGLDSPFDKKRMKEIASQLEEIFIDPSYTELVPYLLPYFVDAEDDAA